MFDSEITEDAFYWASCPQKPFDNELFEEIAISYWSSVTAKYVQTVAAEIPRHSQLVLDFLQDWFEKNDSITFRQVWDPSFGDQVNRMMFGHTGDPAAPLANIALKLTYHGVPGTWSVKFAKPQTLRFGTFILNEVSSIGCRDTGAVSVSCENSDHSARHEIVLQDGDWQCETLRKMPAFGPKDSPILLLPSSALAEGEFTEIKQELLDDIPEASRASFQQTYKVLNQTMPHYAQWFERVITHVMVLPNQGSTIRSGSIRTIPGAVHMSDSRNVIRLGEMLVHEASHQYYHLALHLMQDHYEEPSNLYYSAVKGRERPLSSVILAYHAFANVILYYDACRKAGLDDQDHYIDRHYDNTVSDVESLSNVINGVSSLSALGHGIVAPLEAQLRGVHYG